MAPLIPAIISLITSIPTLVQTFKLIKPIKDKVLAVEKSFTPIIGSEKTHNEQKHAEVLIYLKTFLLPKIKKYGIDEYDMDTMIRFIVLFIRKMRKLRQFKVR